MELEKITNKTKKIYYNNLIKAIKSKNNKINYNKIKNKIKELDNKEMSITESETKNEDVEIIYSDDYLYKKSWSRLSQIHKIIKIREFISKLFIEKNEDKINLEKKLTKLIKNKKLTKKDKVNYNSVKGIIISIPDLEYNNGKYSINI